MDFAAGNVFSPTRSKNSFPRFNVSQMTGLTHKKLLLELMSAARPQGLLWESGVAASSYRADVGFLPFADLLACRLECTIGGQTRLFLVQSKCPLWSALPYETFCDLCPSSVHEVRLYQLETHAVKPFLWQLAELGIVSFEEPGQPFLDVETHNTAATRQNELHQIQGPHRKKVFIRIPLLYN